MPNEIQRGAVTVHQPAHLLPDGLMGFRCPWCVDAHGIGQHSTAAARPSEYEGRCRRGHEWTLERIGSGWYAVFTR